MKQYLIGALAGAVAVALFASFIIYNIGEQRVEFGSYDFSDRDGVIKVRGTLVGRADGDPEYNSHTVWCNEEQRICYDMWVENSYKSDVGHPLFQTYVVSSWGPEKVVAHTRLIALTNNECVFNEIELNRTFRTATIARKPLEGAECRGGEETSRPRQWEFANGWDHPAVTID